MKKLSYLIVLVLILGLALTGCTLLSNVGQVPTSEQSGITYLTKNGPLPNLVGLWHFDEGTGDKAYDSSGNDNDGTVYGASWVTGKFGNALSFDGVNAYVEVPDSASLDSTGVITIECWVKREQAAYQTLISKWSAADNQRSYLVALTADNNVRFWITSSGMWGNLKELTSYGTVGTEWTHIAATYDGDKMNIYIDGVKDANEFSSTIFIFTGTAKLMFGVHPAYMTHGWVPGYFKGILDEVRIWDIALTEFQVAMDIKPQSCPNPINVKNQGVLPVAILGTADFDVTEIDPASVKLEGAAPLRWALEDVATPFEPSTGGFEPCLNCTEEGSDGFLDLTLKFEAQEVIDVLGFGTMALVDESEIILSNDRICRVITLTGYLYDGTPIWGKDTVLIIKKGK